MPSNNANNNCNPNQSMVKTRIQACYFNTRPYYYLCSYKRIVETLAKHSKSFDEIHDSYKLQECVAYQYFKDTSISNNNVYRFRDNYDEKHSLSDCLKSEFSVFRLNVDDDLIKSWFDRGNLYEQAKKYYLRAVLIIKLYKDDFCKIANVDDADFNRIAYNLEAIDGKDSYATFYRRYLLLNEKIRILKFKLNHYYDKNYAKLTISRNHFKKVVSSANQSERDYIYSERRIYRTNANREELLNTDAKEVFLGVLSYLDSRIDDYLDVIAATKNNEFELLAFVSKTGTINLSFAKAKTIEIAYNDSIRTNYGPNNMSLVKEANDKANTVRSTIDKLSKAHMVFDINSLFNDNKKYVLGLYYDSYIDPNDSDFNGFSKNIYRSTNVKKAIYLKLSNDYNLKNNSQESKMFFFNYFSLLIGYFRQFDDYSIYKIAKNYSSGESSYYYEKNVINDLLKQETSHLYYCDSAFTYSIVDPIANSRELDKMTGTNTVNSNIPSHQFNYYSLWYFNKIVEAITFGSASNRIYDLFLRYAEHKLNTDNKLLLLWRQHVVASLFSRIDMLFNHLTFDAKERYFDFVNDCFKCLKVNDFERKAKDSLEITWQHSNLNNGQFYARVGLVFSLASLFLTLVAFGWIGFIVPTFKSQPGDYWGLVQRFLTTTKFYVAFSIATIPFVLWVVLNFIGYIATKCRKKKIVHTFFRGVKPNRFKYFL